MSYSVSGKNVDIVSFPRERQLFGASMFCRMRSRHCRSLAFSQRAVILGGGGGSVCQAVLFLKADTHRLAPVTLACFKLSGPWPLAVYAPELRCPACPLHVDQACRRTRHTLTLCPRRSGLFVSCHSCEQVVWFKMAFSAPRHKYFAAQHIPFSPSAPRMNKPRRKSVQTGEAFISA